MFERRKQSGIKPRLKKRAGHTGWWPNMQQPMQCSERVVGLEDFHLSFWQVLDVLVEGASFAGLGFSRAIGLTKRLESKKARPFGRIASFSDSVLGRGVSEIARCFFVPSAHEDGRIRSARHFFLKALANLHQLRQALHGKEKCGIGATSGLQDLRKVAISKGRKFIEDHGDG